VQKNASPFINVIEHISKKVSYHIERGCIRSIHAAYTSMHTESRCDVKIILFSTKHRNSFEMFYN
jgi:hypothetical protein